MYGRRSSPFADPIEIGEHLCEWTCLAHDEAPPANTSKWSETDVQCFAAIDIYWSARDILMILTFIFALMTAAAALAVLWPLRNSRKAGRTGSDVEVYRDQLDEIERDHAAGRIGKAEAEAARVEVSRRLIAAVDSNQDAVPTDGEWAIRRRRVVAAVALLLLPPCAGSVY